jgi:hypothetical protein
MTLVERISSLTLAWRTVLPYLPEPQPTDVARWCVYADEIAEAAIIRTSKKFTASKLSADFDPSLAYRYVTATARIMAANGAESASGNQKAAE